MKVFLRFRGRENAHKEYGFETIKKFIDELTPYGKPDTQPRKAGRGITVMLAPLPPSKRADNPNPKKHHHEEAPVEVAASEDDNGASLNNAFSDLELPEEKQA